MSDWICVDTNPSGSYDPKTICYYIGTNPLPWMKKLKPSQPITVGANTLTHSPAAGSLSKLWPKYGRATITIAINGGDPMAIDFDMQLYDEDAWGNANGRTPIPKQGGVVLTPSLHLSF